MKMAKHICFHYREDRLKYLKVVIDCTREYEHETDIFIHTNIRPRDLAKKLNDYGIKSGNNNIDIVGHDMKNEHGFFLTWKPRKLIKQQLEENAYCTYMYQEDDIEVTNKTIEYWSCHYENLINRNINLGFIRTEINDLTGVEYWTDSTRHNIRNNIIQNNLLKTDIYYCAFWIYCKKYAQKLIDNIKQPSDLNILREKAAVGLNTFAIDSSEPKFFEKTCIALSGNHIDNRCKVRHLPNNYLNDNMFCHMPCREILKSVVF